MIEHGERAGWAIPVPRVIESAKVVGLRIIEGRVDHDMTDEVCGVAHVATSEIDSRASIVAPHRDRPSTASTGRVGLELLLWTTLGVAARSGRIAP